MKQIILTQYYYMTSTITLTIILLVTVFLYDQKVCRI